MNNKEISFSIIIPYYNIIEGLKKLLAGISVYDDVQVIVVDDRSDTDVEEYTQVKEKYRERGVLFLENDGIKGAGSCMNLGLKYAIGKWILFSGADDYFTEKFHSILLEYADSCADIIYFIPTSVFMDTLEPADRHKGYERKIRTYLADPCHENELQLRYDFHSTCSKLIRREMVLENGIWFEEIIAANDVMFSTKCGYAAKKIAVDTRVIYCITKHKGSLTAQFSEEVISSRMGASLRRFLFLKEHLSQEEMSALNMKENERKMIFWALRNGYPIRKIFRVLREYRKHGVRIWEWGSLIRPAHCLNIVFDSLRIRKRNKNI